MTKIGRSVVVMGLIGVLVGCGGDASTPQPAVAPSPSSVAEATNEPAPPQAAEISGTVSYLERVALPPGAIIGVQLLDTSLQDVEAITMGETTITTSGEQVPIQYTISYDANQIQANHTYSINATITINGAIRFRTTQAFPVLTNGAPMTGDVIVQSMP